MIGSDQQDVSPFLTKAVNSSIPPFPSLSDLGLQMAVQMA